MNEDEEFEFRLRAEKEDSAVSSQNSGVANKVAVGAGVAGIGALGYGIARYINEPNRLIKPINKQLEAIAKKEIGKNVSVLDLPALLDAKYKEFEAGTIKPSMDIVNQNHKIQSDTIRSNRNLFDQKVINPAIDDTAKYVADNYKTFVNSGYESYRASQNAIESIIEQTGQSLRSDDIVNNLFRKTLEESIERGVPENLLSKLNKLASAFDNEGTLVDLLGNKIQTSEPIPFSQIKGNVSYLLKELPDGARHTLADNWSAYMAKYVPEQAKGIFDDMQMKYSKFANARNALFGVIDRNSGSFNTQKLSGKLRKIVYSNQNADLKNLLSAMADGTDITKPVAGLSDKVNGLLDLSQKRYGYETQLINLEKAKALTIEGTQKVKDMLAQGKQEYTKVHRQTLELLSERDAIIEKMPRRSGFLKNPSSAIRGLGGLAKLGGKLAVGLPFGIVSGELDKRAGGFDPAEGFKAWYTGTFGSEQDKQKMSDEYARKIQQQMGI